MSGQRTHAITLAIAAGRGGKAAAILARMTQLHAEGHRVIVRDTCANGDACPMAGSPFTAVSREWTPDGIGAPVLCETCQRGRS